MNLSALFSIFNVILKFINTLMESYNAERLKKAGKDELKLEIKENEDRTRDILNNVNVDRLSDDDAFGNKKSSNNK